MSDEPPPMYLSADVRGYETSSDLVVGIDFGTTYTGVAYAWHQPDNTDVATIAEKVTVIREWPNSTLHYSDKTPTVIAYTEPIRWGGSVNPNHRPQVRHFKLGLQKDVVKHYFPQESPPSPSPLKFLSPYYSSQPGLSDKSPVDFAGDYLTFVHKFVKDEFLPKQFSNVFLKNQQISYVITVPAIWTDAAKALTRQAALKAGIPGHKLVFIPEPEAAALFCATKSQEMNLRDGDHFLVLDAGGGTVVHS
jgi:molecular chaperone DnaK (HSP70)